MVETEEGGTVLQQELFGEQGCERKTGQGGKANEEMLSETGNRHPNAPTLTSNRRGTQTLEGQVERIMIQWLLFPSNS